MKFSWGVMEEIKGESLCGTQKTIKTIKNDERTIVDTLFFCGEGRCVDSGNKVC